MDRLRSDAERRSSSAPISPSSPVPEAARTQLAFMDGMKTLALGGKLPGSRAQPGRYPELRGGRGRRARAENLLSVRNSLERYAPFMALLGIPQPVRKLEAQPKEKRSLS